MPRRTSQLFLLYLNAFPGDNAYRILDAYHHLYENVFTSAPSCLTREEMDDPSPRVALTSPISATSRKRYLPEDGLHGAKRGKEEESRRTYSGNTIHGEARPHLGDNHQHIEYHGTVNQYSCSGESRSRSSKRRLGVLESLKFEEMNDRYINIKPPYAETCQWLFERDEYKAWLDPTKRSEHNGVLWIKGKPGAGKSTLMKRALHHAQNSLGGSNLISFFFNARGEDIEKCAEGAYRSLLAQILERIPRLQSLLDIHRPRDRWTVEVLSTLFQETVMALGEDGLTCYIDGLDECGEAEIRDMIEVFKELTQSAIVKNIDFHVCFSSRHYPHVHMEVYQELVLEQQEDHKGDIAAYIKQKLIVPARSKSDIMSEIQRRASGIFLWVYLVVRILNEDSDRGHAHTIKDRLREIPNDLNELFHNIIKQGTQTDIYLVPTLQWIMFAKRPLSCEELHCAVTYNSAGTPNALEDKANYDSQTTRKFLINSSKGLAETTRGKQSKVQFIHEAVRDYLRVTGFFALIPDLSSNLPGLTHDFLKKCCRRFISEQVCRQLPLPESLPEVKSKKMQELRALAAEKLPFLQYAVSNIFYHAEDACENGIIQDDFIDTFPVAVWAALSNLFEKHTVRRHTASLTKAYAFAEKGTLRLLGAELQQQQSNLAQTQERHRTALCAAVYSDNTEAVAMILKHGAISVYSQAEQRRCFRTAVNNRSTQSLRLLKEDGETVVQSKALQNVLYNYSFHGNVGAVKFLIEQGSSVNAQGTEHGSALQAACCGGHSSSLRFDYRSSYRGHEEVALTLLEHDAELNTEIGLHGNALQAACCGRLTQVVEIMLKKGAKINAHGGLHGHALQAACARGSSDIVRLLLDNGADVNARGGHYGNALHAACSSVESSEEIAQMLLENGAEIDAEGGEYGNSLEAACCRGYETVVQIMLEMGARVDVQGGEHGNALHAACSGRGSEESCEKMVQMLLVEGADVHAQGGEYGTALQAACYRQNENVVQMLLEKGADVHVQGGEYGTALQAACYGQSENVVQTLLEKGVDVNAQGGKCGNALQAACSGEIYGSHDESRERIVKMLLEGGADIHAQGGKYGTALQAACYQQSEKVVQMLLEKGADVNAQGGWYGNALKAASVRENGLQFPISLRNAQTRRRKRIIQMLQSHG